MDEKVDFEVISKRCQYVTYETVRTTSMITITMTTNQ